MQNYNIFCIYANNLIKKVYILVYVKKNVYLCTLLNTFKELCIKLLDNSVC